MKLKVFLIITALVLCLTASALAVELTFDQNCRQKTSSPTFLYVLVDETTGLMQAQQLPAGTYIRENGLSAEGKVGITYSMNNRDPLYGYIDGSVIVRAETTVMVPGVGPVTVGEALARSRTALNLWLDMEYGVTLDGSTYTDENGVEHEIGNEAALEDAGATDGDAVFYQALGVAASNNGFYTPTVYTDDDGNEIPVEVVYMGLARSMIRMNGEQQLVETWRLSWETEAPEDKVIAVVTPGNKSGEVVLYSKPKKSTIIHRVKSNRVLRVIKVGKTYTLVDIDDAETPRGYIHNGNLEFFPNIPMCYQSAKLSVLGRTKGSDPVWIRAEDSSGAARITQFDLGMPMSVYAQNEKWSEVDIGGFHAFILSEFVTIDEEPADAAAEASAGQAAGGE